MARIPDEEQLEKISMEMHKLKHANITLGRIRTEINLAIGQTNINEEDLDLIPLSALKEQPMPYRRYDEARDAALTTDHARYMARLYFLEAYWIDKREDLRKRVFAVADPFPEFLKPANGTFKQLVDGLGYFSYGEGTPMHSLPNTGSINCERPVDRFARSGMGHMAPFMFTK